MSLTVLVIAALIEASLYAVHLSRPADLYADAMARRANDRRMTP